MSTTPTAPTPLTVRKTLALLDGSGDQLFRHFEEAGYALWLGSGISFGRLRRLSDIIRDCLGFLRAKVQPADPNCRFRKALTAALRLVLSDHELAAIDFNLPVASWPAVNELLNRLTSKYADLLDITVDGRRGRLSLVGRRARHGCFCRSGDRTGRRTFVHRYSRARRAFARDHERHWDGLIEKAAEQLSGNKNPINVCVRPEDVRQVGFPVRLYKFHGCAVLALRDENTYRPYLIARKSQIDRWREDHAVLVQSLVNIIRSRATLMIGLSAQDSNIRSAFAAASATLNWPWPGAFPAIAFSQTELGNDQLVLLKNIYRTEMTPANREQIQADSHIPTYAKQLLLALVLKILSGKLKLLLHGVEGKLSDAERDYLAEGLVTLRDIIADAGAADHYDFIRLFIEHFSRLLGIFRNGVVPPDPRLYKALTTSPASHIAFWNYLTSSARARSSCAGFGP